MTRTAIPAGPEASPPPSALPGPPRRLGAGLRLLRRDPLVFLTELASYGDVASVRIGPQRVCLVSHPDLVKDVLVTHGRSFAKGRTLQEAKRLLGEGLLTSEGDHHLRQRRLIQPLFHEQRIAGFGKTMVEASGRAADRWPDCAELDVAQEMMRLTLAIVGLTLFDVDVQGEAAEVGRALDDAMAMVDRFFLPFASVLERLPLPGWRRFHRARADLDAVIERMIEERRRAPEGHEDLLSMLLGARDDEGGAGMASQQVRDEAMTIFLAGYETTAQALTWTWYLLACHPEIEARLQAELDRVLHGGPPAVDDLPRLGYTRAVLAESMRLYPPAWVVGRRALEDVELGGHVVPRGSIVLVSQYVVHHDPRWFREPERFDPDRWLREDENRPRFSYFPFGAGGRMCIGERFAWMEGTLVLATIARRTQFRLVRGHPVELAPRITLRPARGMRMRVIARSARP